MNYRVKLLLLVLPQLAKNQKLLISMKILLILNSNHQKMMVAHPLMNTLLNNAIQKLVNGLQSKQFPLIRKTMQRLRKKKERRRRLRLKLMVLKKATQFNSVYVLRTRVDWVNQVMPPKCTKFDQRK